MITVLQFLNDESRDHKEYIRWLLAKIKELEEDKVEKHVFGCNMYDLEIDFKKETIEIYSLFDEDEYLKLTLEEFYTELFNYY